MHDLSLVLIYCGIGREHFCNVINLSLIAIFIFQSFIGPHAVNKLCKTRNYELLLIR